MVGVKTKELKVEWTPTGGDTVFVDSREAPELMAALVELNHSLHIDPVNKHVAQVLDRVDLYLHDHQRDALSSAIARLIQDEHVSEGDRLACAAICGKGGEAYALRLDFENLNTDTNPIENQNSLKSFLVRIPKNFHFKPNGPTVLARSRFTQELLASEKNYSIGKYAPGAKMSDVLDLLSASGDRNPHIRLLLTRSLIRAATAVHEAGVSHGDIKPDNIIVRNDGRVTIIDGGIAENIVDLKNSDTYSGSKYYMSPEQALGNRCAHSDTYSVGAVVYRLLSGDKFSPSQRMFGSELETPEYLSCLGAFSDLHSRFVIQESSLRESADLSELVIDMMSYNTHDRMTLREARESINNIYKKEYPVISSSFSEARNQIFDRARAIEPYVLT